MTAKQAPKQAAGKAAKKVPSKPKERRPAGGLEVGAKAPSFTLPRDGGGAVSLEDFAGRKLVLYFYPRAEHAGLHHRGDRFLAAETRVRPCRRRRPRRLGRPGARRRTRSRPKHKLTIALGSDETHKMLEAYGVWREKSLYGRKFLGIVRATFLIGPDQRIARIWPKVTVAGHAEEVLAAAKARVRVRPATRIIAEAFTEGRKMPSNSRPWFAHC